MNKIPLHKLADKFNGETAILRYVTRQNDLPAIDYAHRDDYHIFLFIEKGSGKFLIDFQEHAITSGSVYAILPGQVYFPASDIEATGWVLAIDSMLVKDEYQKIFAKSSLLHSRVNLNEEETKELKRCAEALYRRFSPQRGAIQENILHDLFSYYIGIIAEIYHKEFPSPVKNRYASITFDFKNLLSTYYRELKRPSEYASRLNLSSVYLNEAVKKSTGLSASECIQHEIIIQAKRLLYYTPLSIKEITGELGYEDHAYFTRLFTKGSGLSPT
ncbi:MAG: AraC family transcriptional regulator [Bacteroides sp.]|nr:AraC family transcriptional regulator [Bacteroides sp.]